MAKLFFLLATFAFLLVGVCFCDSYHYDDDDAEFENYILDFLWNLTYDEDYENISNLIKVERSQHVEVFDGRPGRDGKQGEKGDRGERGDQGNPGPMGFQGEDGEKGPRGPWGMSGAKGSKGPVGLPGERGLRGENGTIVEGTVYTRWGRAECPDTPNTTILYRGLMVGGHSTLSGGGANYLCLPEEPEYQDKTTIHGHYSRLYGTEYGHSPVYENLLHHNVPCAVCFNEVRNLNLVMPAAITCLWGWVQEYTGYLMTEKALHEHNAMYTCVDQNADSVPGSIQDSSSSSIYHAVGSCNGLPCYPYHENVPITCTVCTASASSLTMLPI